MFKRFRDFDYEVSDEGKVRSIERYITVKSKLGNEYHRYIKERLLKLKNDKNGYKIVILHKNGKDYTFKVHRMVAECFIENPNNYPIVNHKDKNVSNNNVSNLEWCTYSYNNTYGGAGQLRALKTGKALIAYKDGVEVGRYISSYDAAEHLNCTASNIRNYLSGYKSYKTVKGYTFKYQD